MTHVKFITSLRYVAILPFGLPVLAEDTARLSYEAEFEFGYEVTSYSDDTEDRASEAFISSEFAIEFELSDQLTGFAEFSLESASSGNNSERMTSRDLELEQLGVLFGK